MSCLCSISANVFFDMYLKCYTKALHKLVQVNRHASPCPDGTGFSTTLGELVSRTSLLSRLLGVVARNGKKDRKLVKVCYVIQ